MPSRIDDRWVWLGFTIFLSLAAINVRHCIRETVRLTEIDPVQLEDEEVKDEELPEDCKPDHIEDMIFLIINISIAISLATLRTLIDSPNPSISNAAISLAVTRFGRTPQATDILVECYSEDDRLRHEARTIVHYLKDWSLTGHREADWSEAESERDADGMVYTTNDLLADSRERRLRNSRGAAEFEATGSLPSSNVSRWAAGWPSSLPLISTTSPIVGDPGGADISEADRDANLAQNNTILEAMERRRRNRVAMVLHEGDGYVEEGDIYRPG